MEKNACAQAGFYVLLSPNNEQHTCRTRIIGQDVVKIRNLRILTIIMKYASMYRTQSLGHLRVENVEWVHDVFGWQIFSISRHTVLIITLITRVMTSHL